MKKVIYMLLGILTFSIGFLLVNLDSLPVPDSLRVSDPLIVPVSLCEISENPNLYQSGQIHVKAFLAVGGFYDVLSSSVEVADFRNGCLVKANIGTTQFLKNDEILLKLKDELNELRNLPNYKSRDGWAIVEVEIIGEIEDLRKKQVSGDTDFKLKPTKIKQLAPIRFIFPSEVPALDKYLN